MAHPAQRSRHVYQDYNGILFEDGSSILAEDGGETQTSDPLRTSTKTITPAGQANFTIPFDWRDPRDIVVQVKVAGVFVTRVFTTHYTVVGSEVIFNSAFIPAAGVADSLILSRFTPRGHLEHRNPDSQPTFIAEEIEDQLVWAPYMLQARGAGEITSDWFEFNLVSTGALPIAVHDSLVLRKCAAVAYHGDVGSPPSAWTAALQKNNVPVDLATFEINFNAAADVIEVTTGEWSEPIDVNLGDTFRVKWSGALITNPFCNLSLGVRTRTPR